MIVRDHFLKWVNRDPLRYHSLHADMISARTGMTLEQYLWRSMKIALLVRYPVCYSRLRCQRLFQPPGSDRQGRNLQCFQYPAAGLFQCPLSCRLHAGYCHHSLLYYRHIYRVHRCSCDFPALEKNNRKIKINLTLHNAVAYMYAMRRGGAQMMTIFRSLSDRANIYGEVALEFRQIVRDADFFGYDVVSAIRHLSETTPSEKLKDFLEDLLSVIESGGDMAEFLSMRVRLYQEEARFEQKQFLNVLSIVAESYVTLFVAGPLFLIIIMVVMGMMGGSAVLQLALVTYAVHADRFGGFHPAHRSHIDQGRKDGTLCQDQVAPYLFRCHHCQKRRMRNHSLSN